MRLGVVVHTFNLNTGEAEADGSLWVQAPLVYKAKESRKPRAVTQRNPVSKNQKKRKEKKKTKTKKRKERQRTLGYKPVLGQSQLKPKVAIE